MDSYQQQQQHHRYMRPPQPPPPPVPPPSSDPHHYPHHQSRPPFPPQAPWYPNQFQYNQQPPLPPPSSHSPSPPPPQQWAAPPHSDHLSHAPPPSAYPPPPPQPNPYPSYHPQPGQQFPPPPPPRGHLPAPPPPPHSQIPQSYPQVNQEWGNPNWGQHQAWDYQVGAHNNVEDWAAKARAWATQNAAMEDQNHQSQFTQVSRMEEQNRYHDQYQQAPDSYYQDNQQQPYPASGYQQFPSSAAPSQQQPIVYQQENASLSSGNSSNDSHFPYTVGGGTSFGAPTTSSSVLQQEVPSSYSSVTAGKEEATVQMDQPYKSLPLPISSAQGQHQTPMSGLGGSALIEQSFAYGNQRADLTIDLSNQPLEFASGFSRDHDPHMQTSYGSHHDSAGSGRGHGPGPPLPSINSWSPAVATGAVYSQIPSGLSHQHDPSLAIPSISGHAPPPFGSYPGTSFQPTIPTAGAPYGLGSGTVLPPSTGFSSDAYGISNVSERPKKASVPNWLKEEIIKNASVITRSSIEHPKEETQSIEDEGVEKSSGKTDQADSKSIDSSRSTEEEDEDEDDIEASRTVAINQEIKRILTEVLLKVTDELFEEIATKVIDDDDLTDEVDRSTVTLDDKVSLSPPEVPTPKASAKVLLPVRAKEFVDENTSEKSSSGAPGNLLGLANYASDDDDDDDEEEEIKSSTISKSRENNVHQQPEIAKISEGLSDATENGRSPVHIGKNIEEQMDSETEQVETNNNKSRRQINATTSELSDYKYSSAVVSGTKGVETIVDGRKRSHTSNGSGSKAAFGENVIDDSQVRETKKELYEDQEHERKQNYSGKEKDSKEAERRSRTDEKGDGNHRKQDEKHPRKQKVDDRDSSLKKAKVQGDRTGEKAKESDSRKKSSHLDVKEHRKESERLHRSSTKEKDDKKRGRGKDKEEDRGRHKLTKDSSKHKRRRSSSTSSKGRNSSDEASDGSKRRLHSRKRNLSPSPVRSRRRQVSRSPHSKHSQRRHSPYSSIETARGKRSRSKSPVRRRSRSKSPVRRRSRSKSPVRRRSRSKSPVRRHR